MSRAFLSEARVALVTSVAVGAVILVGGLVAHAMRPPEPQPRVCQVLKLRGEAGMVTWCEPAEGRR
jgi:hypothetical protein